MQKTKKQNNNNNNNYYKAEIIKRDNIAYVRAYIIPHLSFSNAKEKYSTNHQREIH